MQINSLVKKKAADLEIDLCGITDGTELKKEREILAKRSRSQYWPQVFTNQDLDQLTQPALHFENLESIIVIAQSYKNKDNQFLSNYVTVRDYHNILQQKLKKLAVELQQKLEKNFNYKIFVDTAPFLERALAKRAGLGFIGKNSMLINPNLGSYLFLGELFTDLKIDTDSPLDLNCGECQLCLENCAGKALKSEYLLEARDCISYLTQKKGILTEKEMDKIGTHIWGCDICQKVCPYNQSEAVAPVKFKFFDRGLEYFLSLDRKNPPAELKRTAITWRGIRILVRNALIAAANLKDQRYFAAAEEKLTDNSPVIRYYAARAVLKINYKQAREMVKKIAAQENNNTYRKKIEDILEQEEVRNGY